MKIKTYISNPVIYEAARVGYHKPWGMVADWCNGTILTDNSKNFSILVNHGTVHTEQAEIGDWIVKCIDNPQRVHIVMSDKNFLKVFMEFKDN